MVFMWKKDIWMNLMNYEIKSNLALLKNCHWEFDCCRNILNALDMTAVTIVLGLCEVTGENNNCHNTLSDCSLLFHLLGRSLKEDMIRLLSHLKTWCHNSCSSFESYSWEWQLSQHFVRIGFLTRYHASELMLQLYVLPSSLSRRW